PPPRPGAAPPPEAAPFALHRAVVPLGADFGGRLASAAAAAGVTPFALLAAGYQLFLARLTSDRRVPVATPVDMHGPLRDRAVGCFIETGVIAADLAPGSDRATLVAAVAEALRAAQRGAGPALALRPVPGCPLPLPGARFLIALEAPEAAAAGAASLMLGRGQPGGDPARLGDWAVAPLPPEPGASLYDLSLMAVAAGDTMAAALDLRAGAFAPASAPLLADRLADCLDAVVAAQPYAVLDRAPRHAPARTPAPSAGPDTLVDLVRRAALTPSGAVLADDRRVPVDRLLDRARRVAGGLIERGVTVETPVALMTDPGPDALAVMVGIWLAGAVVVPLDPRGPAARAATILADCDAALVVADSDRVGGPPVADPAALLAGEPVDLAALPPVAPDHLAYLIATSGSSGTPKAVMGSHRGAADFAVAQAGAIGLGPGDVVLQLAPWSFDASLSDILMALHSGADLCLATGEARLPGPALAALIERAGVTVITAPPSVLAALPERRYASVRTVISMAEACTPAALARWQPGRRFFNGYGPTEAAIGATLCALGPDDPPASLGTPLGMGTVQVLDDRMRPVAPGGTGEIYLGGPGLARGYLGRPAQTARAFVPDPTRHGGRLYRTGDRARVDADGRLLFAGRVDRQIKVRGHRVDPEEIEAVAAAVPGVTQARLCETPSGVALTVPALAVVADPGAAVDVDAIRHALRTALPGYMQPRHIALLPALPLTAAGKVDAKALAARVDGAKPDADAPPGLVDASPGIEASTADLERRLLARYRARFALPHLRATDNIFEAGGHSLALAGLKADCAALGGRAAELRLTDFFRYPTVRAMAEHLASRPRVDPAATPTPKPVDGQGRRAVAVIGLGLRLPGGIDTPERFWDLLAHGGEALTRFDRDAWVAAGLDPALFDDPGFVPVRGVVDAIDSIDADHFGLGAREASLMDPQLRLLMETTQWAFDDAGCRPDRLDAAVDDPARNRVGVFCGAGPETYYHHHIAPDTTLMAALGPVKARQGAATSFFATQLAYRFGLTGPALTVDTACSTGLVAVHQACAALRGGQCEMALAGAASLALPQTGGHSYEPGGIGSPDGHCRAYDADAAGTVRSGGAVMVLLKPLAAALADGDRIHGVIDGSAVNNDGRRKVGFTAPSVDGQAAVIAAARADAGVGPRDIAYVEGHGTATPVGDPVEVAALNLAFEGQARRAIGLGSVKANLGHLDAAAGLAGLVKVLLAFRHAVWPATPHHRRPNPEIDFDGGPFRVVAAAEPWPGQPGDAGSPRRAGVSAFGIGGTNAHLVLRAPPAPVGITPAATTPSRPLLVSGSTRAAARSMARAVAGRLDAGACPAGIARTLATARRPGRYRAALCDTDGAALAARLRADDLPMWQMPCDPDAASVALLLPGQGAARLAPVAALAAAETGFADHLAAVSVRSVGIGGPDVTALVAAGDDAALTATAIAQPALMAVHVAVARWLADWGIRPHTLIGHSLGEVTALHLAGGLDLDAALGFAVARGAAMAACPEGAMLAVAAGVDDVRPLLAGDVWITADNGPHDVTVGGTPTAVARLADGLDAAGIAAVRLATDRAFHTPLMEPAVERLGGAVAALSMAPPRLGVLSTMTGTALAADRAPEGDHLLAQIVKPVRFADALAALDPQVRAVLDLGPGRGLAALVRRTLATGCPAVLALLARGPVEAMDAIGQLWALGAADPGASADGPVWHGVARAEAPLTVFARQRHWIDPPAAVAGPLVGPATPVAGDPRTSSGAVAKTGARDEGGATTEANTAGRAGEGGEAGTGTLAAAVAEAWQCLLGGAAPGPDSDFFAAGGSSLDVLRLCATLERTLGRAVDPRCVYEQPRMGALCAALAQTGAPAAARPAPSGNRPLSPQQAAFAYLLARGHPSAAFVLPYVMEIDGDLDIDRLAAAFAGVVARHPILATRLAHGADGPMLTPVAAPSLLRLAAAPSLASLPAAADHQALLPVPEPEAGPMIRAALWAEAPGRHRLWVALHHLVADGLSLHRLFDDLAAAYRAPETPPTPATDYADFVAAQAARLADPDLARDLDAEAAAWRARLDGAVAARLTPDRSDATTPRPGFAAAEQPVPLDRAARAGLERTAQAAGATGFAAVTAALARVVGRWTGCGDVTLGAAFAGRVAAGHVDTVGCFAVGLPVRVTLPAGATLVDTTAAVDAWLKAAQAIQDLPLDRLRPPTAATSAGIKAVADGPPFTILIAETVASECPPDFGPGLHVRPVPVSRSHTQYDLMVWVTRKAAGWQAALEYRADLFSAAAMVRFAADLASELAGGVGQRDRVDPAIVPPAPGVDADHPAAESVAALIARQCAAGSGRPAYRLADGPARAYADLAREVAVVVAALNRAGLTRHGRVGLCMTRCKALPGAVVGILAAGGVYVPLEPDLPAARLATMMTLAGVEIVLATSDTVACLPGEPAIPVLLADRLPPVDEAALPPAPGLEDPAYILFTSGSTGEPKGAVNTHGGLANRVAWMVRRFGVGPDDRVLQKTPLGFDVSLWELLTPLAAGATLVLAAPDAHKRPDRLARTMAESSVTVAHFVPSAFPAFVQAADPQALSALRLLAFSGEALTPDLLAAFEDRFADHPAALVNLYGPTETAIEVSCWQHRRGQVPARVPIGTAIDGVRLSVRDAWLDPVAAGTAGEICIGGVAVGWGYVGRPGATAAAFRPDPAGPPGARLYRTGDLGAVGADGQILYLGRRDRQVKLRGQRLELDEIRLALVADARVAEAAVVPGRTAAGETVVRAFVVPTADAARDGLGAALRDRLGHGLPGWMVPGEIGLLDALPLTRSGKLDVAALPGAPGAAEPAAPAPMDAPARVVPAQAPEQAPEQAEAPEHAQAQPRASAEATAPGALRAAVLAAWRDVLARPDLDADADFFAHGGTSLSAARLAARLETVLGRPVDLAWVVEGRTPAAVAAMLADSAGVPPEVSPEPRSVPPSAPRSVAASALSTGAAGETAVPAPGSALALSDLQAAYRLGRSTAFALGGSGTRGYLEVEVAGLDPDRFAAAVHAVIARHDALRSVITDAGLEILADPPAFVPGVEDLRGASADAQAEALEARRGALQAGRAALDRWPLFDIHLTLLPNDRTRVHLSVEAIILDGQSAAILERDLNIAYDALGQGDAPGDALPPPRHRLADAVAARDRWSAAHRPAARAWWQMRLATLPDAPALPYARPLGTIEAPESRRTPVLSLDGTAWAALTECAGERGVTPSALLLTVFALTLADFAAAPDFTVNVTIDDRPADLADADAVVGNFTSAVLAGVRAQAACPVVQTARAVQAEVLAGYAHRAYGGPAVVRDLARVRGRVGDALMPVVFTSLLTERAPGADDRPTARPGVIDFSRPMAGVAFTSQAALDCVCWPTGEGGVEVVWDSVAQALAPETLAAMADRFAAIARSVARHGLDRPPPARPPDQGDDLGAGPGAGAATDQEAQGALDDQAIRGRLDRMVLDAAAADPVACAVAAPDRRLRYGELVAEARTLAEALRDAGVAPGDRVGLHLPSGWRAVVAMLAIHLVDAAYVPVTPSLPARRRADLLDRCGVRVLVSDQASEPEAAVCDTRVCVLVPDQPSVAAVATRRDVRAADAADPDDPDALAYVIFTSGSTGVPKGVAVSHAAAANTIVHINRRFAVGPADRLLAVSSLGFDLAVYDVFGTLAAGACLVIPPPGPGPINPAQWGQAVAQERVTVWNSVPALMGLFLDQWQADGRGALDSLRLCLLSGDWVPVPLPDRVRALAPGAGIVSLGGATEAAIWSIAYEIGAVDPAWASIPYGRALPGQEVVVVDGALAPRPVGVTGQIAIAGAGLALGYHGDPAETARRFVTRACDGRRFYLTGDLGRRMASGDIEFLGREDTQVKIRGNRLELGEVEAALESHPGVDRALVVAECDGEGRQVVRLAGYVSEATAGLRRVRSDGAVAFRAEAVAAAVRAGLAGHGDAARTAPDDATLAALLDEMTETYTASVLAAFERLDLFQTVDRWQTVEEARAQAGLQPRYRRWLARACDHLAGLGLLCEADGGGYARPPAPLSLPSPPAAEAEPWLADILTGRRHSGELYAAAGMEEAYERHFATAYAGVRAALAALLPTGPEAPRVLEVGAGYGTLTRHVVDLFDAGAQYLFTDVSQFFLEKARGSLDARAVVQTDLLDLDRDMGVQGVPADAFDLVLAASVVHAVPDIRRTLGHLFAVMAPGGVLVMVEETRFWPFFDLGMGLQQGFDSARDTDLRPDHALLDRRQWDDELRRAGFEAFALVTPEGAAADRLGFDVIVARVPDTKPVFDSAGLLAHVRARLAAHAVPAAVLPVARWPLTANGKIDRAAFRRLSAPKTVAASAELDADQARVAALWTDILGETPVAPGADFFALGGDSLSASKLVIAFKGQLGVDVPISLVFEAPTLAEQAELVAVAAAMVETAGATADTDGAATWAAVEGEL
ncbi:hypothetical protein CCR85_05990, partial [Rhodothalassium salexigens]|nr:hypothetical protein [Rhodothalassium salexigens]